MDGERIACLILALESHNLLVPQSLVVEVGLDKPVAPITGAPVWLAGIVEWQGRRLPVLDFERLCGASETPDRVRRLVVLQSVGGHSDIAFYALRVKGVPHPLYVGSDDAQPVEETLPEGCEEWIVARTSVAGIVCSIPDVDALERRINQL